jgi:hypothetical protein
MGRYRALLFNCEGIPLETLIQTFVAVIVAVLGSNGLWAYLQSRSKATSARDRMLLGLGHAEIFRTAEKYIQRGGITTDELEDLEKYLYKPYSELGGNGTAQSIVEKCKQLPIISASEAERMDANG